MLIQFNFKNFRSFREETVLDLSATDIPEFTERVVPVGDERILPAAAIYGANGGGKSNICGAFSYMTDTVLDSFRRGEAGEPFYPCRPKTYLLDPASVGAESSFEVYFTDPGDPAGMTYNYGFCANAGGVTEEWLNTRAKNEGESSPVFYRSPMDGNLEMPGIPAEARESLRGKLSDEVLAVSLGAGLHIDVCEKVRGWFADNRLSGPGDPFRPAGISGALPEGFADDDKVRQKVVNFLSAFDDSIQGFKVRQVPGAGGEEHTEVLALHKTDDPWIMVEFPLERESAGTRKMFSLYPVLEHVMKTGSVFFADDLDASLHPLLERDLLLLFLDPEINRNHAQVVFTTHDTWLLSARLLRRDEVWFAKKDTNGASSLYSLADFGEDGGAGPGKNRTWEESYLYGEYGAIPRLESLDVFGD